jgi:hypothetical protein
LRPLSFRRRSYRAFLSASPLPRHKHMETEMTTYSEYSEPVGVRHLSNSSRIWYVVGGIAFLIMALFAFAIPVAATFAANLWLGALLIVAGIVETIGAFRRHDGWAPWAKPCSASSRQLQASLRWCFR